LLQQNHDTRTQAKRRDIARRILMQIIQYIEATIAFGLLTPLKEL
jgi:hypothetical protein